MLGVLLHLDGVDVQGVVRSVGGIVRVGDAQVDLLTNGLGACLEEQNSMSNRARSRTLTLGVVMHLLRTLSIAFAISSLVL